MDIEDMQSNSCGSQIVNPASMYCYICRHMALGAEIGFEPMTSNLWGWRAAKLLYSAILKAQRLSCLLCCSKIAT